MNKIKTKTRHRNRALTGCMMALLWLLVPSSIFAQQLAPQHAWSFGLVKSNVKNVKTDSLGNIYIAGYSDVTADFDPGTASSPLASAGGYIAKYTPSKQLIWVTPIVATAVNDFDVSSTGSVAVVGSNGGAIINIYNPAGGLQYSYGLANSGNNGGSSSYDVTNCIFDKNGNLIVRGRAGTSPAPGFSGPGIGADIDPAPGFQSATTLINATTDWLMRLSPTFTLLSYKFIGSGIIGSNDFAISGDTLYWATSHANTATAVDYNQGASPALLVQEENALIAYRTTNFTPIWGGPFKTGAQKMLIESTPTGEIALLFQTNYGRNATYTYPIDGSYYNTLSPAGSSPHGYYNNYLLHYNKQTGALNITNKAPRLLVDSANSLANLYVSGFTVDKRGNYFISGSVGGYVDFQNGTGIYSRSSSGSIDPYFVKYKPNLSVDYAAIFPNSINSNDNFNGIAAIDTSSIVVAGSYRNTHNVDSLKLAPNLPFNVATEDNVVLAKYMGDPCRILITSTSVDTFLGCQYTFAITASSPTSPLSYQWFKNGALLTGQTTNSTSATGVGTYQCRVSNACGEQWSKKYVLSALPAITYSSTYYLDSNLTGTPNGVGTAITYGADRAGNANKAAVFNGTSSVIDITNPTFNNGISLWFKRADITTRKSMSLVSYQVAAPGAWNPVMYLDSSGRLSGFVYDGTANPPIYSSGFVNDTLWHHAAWTYDAALGQQKLFLDGTLVGTRASNALATGAANIIKIGNGYIQSYPNLTGSGNAHFFKGSIDNVFLSSTISNARAEAMSKSPAFFKIDLGLLYTPKTKDVCSVTNFTLNAGILTNPNTGNQVSYTWVYVDQTTSPFTFTTLTNSATISGATTPNLVVTNANPATFSLGYFRLTISDAYCYVDEADIRLNLTTGVGTITQPTNTSACLGSNAIFVAKATVATGYQWKKNGVNIPSSNNDTLFLNNIVAGDYTTYTCDITGCGGTVVTSNTVTLSQPTVAILTQTSASSNPACVGSNTVLFVNAQNAVSYQWKKGGVNISNTNNDTLFLTNVQAADAGSYTCEITSCSGGTVTSNALAVTTTLNSTSTNLIHHWKLNSNLTPSVGTINLTPVSTLYNYNVDRNGVASNGLQFATSTTTNALVLSTPITQDNISISLWYNKGNSTTVETLIGDNGTNYGDMLGINASGKLGYQVGGSGFQSSGVTVTNGWHHFVVTKSGSTMKMYMDGTQIIFGGGLATPPTMGVGTLIGRIGNTAPIYNTNMAKGIFDDIRIYSAVLSTSEVNNLYQAPEILGIGVFAAVCAGGTTSTSVLTSGNANTTYQWQKAGVNIPGANSSTLTLTNVQAGDAGNYACVVGSSAGCVATTSGNATLTLATGGVTFTTQPQPQSKCVGQPVTFTVAATGGTGYQWKKNGSALSGQTSATLNISAVALTDTGTYTCDITGGTCGSTPSNAAYLTVNAVPSASISPSTVSICAGVSQTLTASGNGTYTWSNSGGSTAAATFTPSSTTTYTVTVSAGICSATASSTVTVNAIPTASITPATVTICAGDAANLTASGGGTYAWSNSGGTAAAASFSPTTTSTYTVTVTANNCSATASRLVTVNALPTASITPSTAVVVCAGSPATLTAAGGTSYAWSNSGGTAAAATFSPTTTSTYTVTVTANNCSATASKLVTVNALPLATLTPAAPVICAGASQTLTAGGGSSYAWSAGLGTGVSKSVSPTSTTMYTITATDANNCSASASATVSVTTVVAAINGPTTICSGLSATLTASGGGTYAWSNSLGSAAAVTVSPTTATTYTVTVTNNNCTATASQTVSVQSAPTAVINGASSVCAGSSITLTANGGNTYTWSNGGGTSASATFSPTTATTYTVTASLGAGCTATATKTITIKQPTSGSYSQTICFGQSVLFNGISRAQSGAYLDTLVNLAGCDSFLTLNLTVRPQITGSIAQTVCFGGSTTFNGATLTQSGVFKDTLTSVTGCDSILTLTFTVRPRIATSITQPICNGSAITFNGQTITTAGTYLDTLTSVNGCDSFITLNVTIAQATAATISKSACGSYSFGGNTLTASGTYLDTISNVAGCDSVITLNLTINQATASTMFDTICNGDSYSFGAQTLNQSGTYNRTITNVAGCDSVITLNLFVRPAVAVTASASGFNLSATAGFVAYQWKLNGSAISGANTQTYTAVANGAYTVEVTDANGCKGTSNTVNVVGVGIENLSNHQLNYLSESGYRYHYH
jgi:hypothetical protein